MKSNTAILAAALAFGALAPLPGFAQAAMDHGAMQTAEGDAMSDGEVRKIDKETGKITIKHGPIKNLDMPPMSMVFTAKEKALLDKVKVGDKIRFMAADEGGKIMVTDIQPAP
jgi:Cu/Ag efflux protein CusF